MNEPLGVGIIGTGAATQAIHVPVLARLRDRLRVTHIVGTDKRHVAAVAARAGARGGTSVEELLKDPAVDLVAVCGPNHLHAAQAAAACAAGKRGVLVEKPMALSRDEAAMVAGASARHGVPLVVGAMHSWDQAWRAASQAWLEAGGETRLIRSAIHLPVNDVILEQVTDPTRPPGRRVPYGVITRLGSAKRVLRPPDLAEREARLRAIILGFAVHAIPLIRVIAPGLETVGFARPTFPWGYALTYDADPTAVTMTGSIGGRWTPTWTFDAWAADRRMHVEFPPAFVMAGSAEASISGPEQRMFWRTPLDGYQAEWLHLADVVQGRAELAISVPAAVEDILHAISLADAAGERLRRDAAEQAG